MKTKGITSSLSSLALKQCIQRGICVCIKMCKIYIARCVFVYVVFRGEKPVDNNFLLLICLNYVAVHM